MSNIGPNDPLFVETYHRMNDIQREAKMATLRKQALLSRSQESLFKRLALPLAALLNVNPARTETPVENLGQPILKRSTATMSKV